MYPPLRRASPSPTRATTKDRTGYLVRGGGVVVVVVAVARLLCSALVCARANDDGYGASVGGGRAVRASERTCGVERYSSPTGGRGVEIPRRNRMGRAV